jgi:hypothetical protein
MPLDAGTRLDHYEILGPLGAGGMGEVYRALDTTLKREVAIKVLPPQFARDPARLARFEREAQLLASLNHPNIVQPSVSAGRAEGAVQDANQKCVLGRRAGWAAVLLPIPVGASSPAPYKAV